MYDGVKFIPLVIAGLASIIWGVPAAHRIRSPFDIAAALAVLAGVVLAVLGVLLVTVPNFFR